MRYKANKRWEDLRVGDILTQDISTTIGELTGNILLQVVKTRSGYVKRVIADNGGVGYITKGNDAPLNTVDDLWGCRRIGTNYNAKFVKLEKKRKVKK